METHPLTEGELNKKQKKIREKLAEKIAQAPKWK